MTNRKIFAGLAFVVFAPCSKSLHGQATTAPSFSCAHVTSRVNKLICSTPHLAQLDQELAMVFNNMQGQPIDRNELRVEEDEWLAALRRDCTDVGCIESRYRARLRFLQDESLRIASPAAYEETRPFAVPAGLLKEAEERIGKPCDSEDGLVNATISGFELPSTRFQPILGSGYVVVVRQGGGHYFAFLLTPAPSSETACRIRDSVSLPPAISASQFVQCSNQDPPLSGFGVRAPSQKDLLAFWIVNRDQLRFERVPINTMGLERAIQCHQPEGAD
jgi:hypothetical protein